MPKKVTLEDFQNGKEYKMWGHLFEMTQTMDLLNGLMLLQH